MRFALHFIDGTPSKTIEGDGSNFSQACKKNGLTNNDLHMLDYFELVSVGHKKEEKSAHARS